MKLTQQNLRLISQEKRDELRKYAGFLLECVISGMDAEKADEKLMEKFDTFLKEANT